MNILHKYDLKSISKIRDEILKGNDLINLQYYDSGKIYFLNEVCIEFYCNSIQEFAYQLLDYSYFNLSESRFISDNDNYNLIIEKEGNILKYYEEWNEVNYLKISEVNFSELSAKSKILYESINIELKFLIEDISKTSQFEDHLNFLNKAH